jgi:hypothetical protein
MIGTQLAGTVTPVGDPAFGRDTRPGATGRGRV